MKRIKRQYAKELLRMGEQLGRQYSQLETRIANLETDIKDAADHYGDSFGEVEERLSGLEGGMEELRRTATAREVNRQFAKFCGRR